MEGPDQLSLAIEPPEDLESGSRLPARVRAMQPMGGDGPFDDPDYFFEPWWPGARTIVFVEEGHIRLQSEHLADPLGPFPELSAIAAQARGTGLVLDGTLLVLDEANRPDNDLLRRRLENTDHSGHPAFVATDLLRADGRSLAARPFAARRDRLTTLLPDGEWAVVGRGYRGEGRTVATALGRMGIPDMSARRLSAPYVAGPAGDAWLRLPVAPAEVRNVRPSLTLIQRLPLD